MDSRRGFLLKLLGSATALLTVDLSQTWASEGKKSRNLVRESPDRENYIVPPGAESFTNFHHRCIGCQLCVSSCPNRVLNVKASHIVIDPKFGLLNLNQPAMSFEHGYCHPECNKCSQVCPAGAILPVTLERKSSIKIGLAKWKRELCRNTKGKTCRACVKFCPNEAIKLVPSDGDPQKIELVIDPNRCVGCGACEYICRNYPKPAIYVDGFAEHGDKKG
ncbi:4Fe-4S dicluster domain-containing protein [bacterium]|nr:4Fe-4S dicluster domain-containing protein [bacterium]